MNYALTNQKSNIQDKLMNLQKFIKTVKKRDISPKLPKKRRLLVKNTVFETSSIISPKRPKFREKCEN